MNPRLQLLTTPLSKSSAVAYCLRPFDKRSTSAKGLLVARLNFEPLEFRTTGEAREKDLRQAEQVEPRDKLPLAAFAAVVRSIVRDFLPARAGAWKNRLRRGEERRGANEAQQ